jgi:hypothetical protein
LCCVVGRLLRLGVLVDDFFLSFFVQHPKIYNKLCVIFSSSTSTLRIIGVTIFFDSGGVGVDADKEEEEADKEEDKEEEDKEEEDKEGNWRRRPTDGQKRRKSSWFGKKNALGTQNDDDDDAALDERR